MALLTFRKDPDAEKVYGFNWALWLAETSETISTSVWTVPTGLTSSDETKDDTQTSIKISGGTAGETYEVVNRITTSTHGQIEEWTMEFIIEEQ